MTQRISQRRQHAVRDAATSQRQQTPLETIAASTRRNLRFALCRGVARSGSDPGYEQFLAAGLQHPVVQNRAAVVQAYGSLSPYFKDPEVIVACAADPEPLVRVKACQALAEMEATSKHETLAKLLEDSVPEVQCAAVQALGSAIYCGAWGFPIFLFGRFFSGIWAAVGATCNVYITDVCPEELRATYIAKLSTVPLVALLFGPGLGGGMSKLGLNVPVAVDGFITICSACLVSYYLPETPSFLRSRQALRETATDPESPAAKQASVKTPIPRAVYWLGFAQFLGGIGFSTLLSMFALFMLEKYNFDGLRIGFSFMGGSLAMMMVNVWGVPFCKKYFTQPQTVVLGGIINGLGFISFGLSNALVASLIALYVSFAGNALRGANTTAYLGSFSDATNRGAIFGLSQVFMNTGRMIGPVMATHLADWYTLGTPFYVAGVMSLSAASITLLVERKQRQQKPAAEAVAQTGGSGLKRKETTFGKDWKDQVGSKEDVEALGRFVANLLSQRHYQWVTKRAEIERLLDHLLPELQVSDRQAYEEALHNVEGRQF